ncbi:non-ribosomal peptide synthetase [Pseudoalteromonas luteoviolacea]|uniref:Carrier domain-containing protein n=1 Tax=Pseudoalteromonas luteoviolacea S4054 TaxID=1129367 RepID=A0A0F6AIG7_9GAMM|nr:non-ribosomal peptide synthetase [Pseudoalteromonas luteoviolacea]AOT10861.1 hypothetical protein S4054249_23740 [Pseudoalteromonas luteoviolacea]AOT15977.1 hypothetical protein S40542_24770 [Pseudoalteromonas luteoviolacea]AOT20682.1 hypothetical protein S4054_23660 [Pseudoalteromonas luteoviolacea]KKE85716.1 hypothetical protein N479_24980 [Pseudoalteromonas luteoviolacea S4054]KZN67311.1 hypothetical protein N481_24015 [Pseudoalteromonas luteoviolacea S4047-1]
MNNTFPLTLTQRDIFFDQMHYLDSPLYNIGGYIKCRDIDIERMQAAHKQLVLSHDVFGIRIVQETESVSQYVSDDRLWDLPVYDFTGEKNPEQAALTWLDTRFQTKTEYIDSQLCFGYLLKLTTQDYWYVGISHHLAMDGWGFSNWSYKLAEYYNQGTQEGSIDQEGLSYQAMSDSDQQYQQSKRYESDKAFWCEHLKNSAEKLLMPHSQNQYHDVKYIPSTRYRHYMSRDVFAACTEAAAGMGVGVPQYFLAVLAYYFSAVSSASTVAFGIPAHNRKNHKQKSKVGVFTSVSTLNIEVLSEGNFKQLAQQITQLQKASFRHQRFPVGDLTSVLSRANNQHNTSALSDVTFNYLKLDYGALKFADNNASVIYHTSGFDTTPLTVTIWDGDDEDIEIQLDYNHAYFSSDEIQSLADRFQHLLECFCQQDNIERSLSTLSVLTDTEQAKLIAAMEHGEDAYQQGVCIHELFEQQVAKRPEAIALEYAGEQLTYAQLNTRANQLAHYLIAQGVQVEQSVGVCLPRSIDMVVSVLAILKAGATYIPLDPEYPSTRLKHIFEDTDLAHLVTHSSLLSKLPVSGMALHVSDELAGVVAGASTDNVMPRAGHSDSSLAYMIFTSGSTGKPKGVMIEHRAFVNLLEGVADSVSGAFSWPNKLLAVTTIAFDIAGLELFGPLIYGGQMVIASSAQAKDPRQLAALLETHQINFMQATPVTWTMLVNDGWQGQPDLVALTCGEALSPQLAQALVPLTRQLWNGYGPTEATIFSLLQEVDAQQVESGLITLGGTLGNYSHVVLNELGQIQPMGCVGELHIGGAGLARGYLKRAALTAERFMDNPYYDPHNAMSSKKLYKTGDLVRYLPDGKLAYLGRIDDQVKIRGFRIELGEVEAQLCEQQGVDSALVVAKEVAGSQQLVGYIKREADEVLSESELTEKVKHALQAVLPSYMVPSSLIVMAEWPVTPNGKIDKKALPSPDTNALLGEYVTPKGDTAIELAQLWGSLLGIEADHVSATANFFNLGGHSLLTTRLVAEIRRVFAVDISVQDIFEQTTLQGLAEVIEAGQTSNLPPIEAVTRADGKAVLSYSQQRLWFIDKLQEGTPEYNMPVAFNLSGKFDRELMTQVFSTIIARHEILRTIYKEENGQAYQHIRAVDDVDFTIAENDLSDLTCETQKEAIEAHVVAQMQRPFNLSQDVMVRVSYIHTGPNNGVLIFNMHHIASDGWSVEVLMNEFMALYEAYYQGQPNPLAPLDIQYADFAVWQQNHVEQAQLGEQLAYWESQLEDAPVVHSLPLDKPRGDNKQPLGAVVTGELDATTVAQLNTVAQAYRVTPFMLLHSALALLLSRHSGSDDIVIGTPVANRLQSELAPLIGYFVNTLVLRTSMKHADMESYLAHVKAVHLGAQSHQDVPFEQVVERLNIPRSQAHSPLFQIMLTVDNGYGVGEQVDFNQFNFGELTCKPYQSDVVQAKFDLNVEVSLNEQGGAINWTYDISLFEQTHIEQLNAHLCRLLSAMAEVDTAHTPALHELNMLSEAETRHLVHELNDAVYTYPDTLCIHQRFEQQAVEQPDAVALVHEQTELSYGELNRQANQLAQYLVAHHQVGPDTLIGICVSRSVSMVVGILAILKAGGAYVPLDPNYPKDRLEYMLDDAKIAVVLSNRQVQSCLPCFEGEVLLLDGEARPWGAYPEQNLCVKERGLSADSLAYLIYTSGSTGKPKGVMVEHRNILALSHEMQTWFSPITRFGWCANYVFDASLQGLCFLFSGSTLVIVPDELKLQTEQLKAYVTQHCIELMDCTPSVLHFWLEEWGAGCLPHLLVGGEAITPQMWQKLSQMGEQGIDIFNVYGPTECTVNSTMAKVTGERSHIGQPLSYASAYILATHEHGLSPYGAIGELCIGGPGVARGYLNRGTLTTERFVANPYYDARNPASSKTLYKTGDLVRYLPDGQIDFLGRIDDQVKIRGYRIELGEIEAQLCKLEGVDSALVMTQAVAGSPQVVGYVMPKESQLERLKDKQELHEFLQHIAVSLKSVLPEHMLPSGMSVVDAWPLTPNGKIDKKSLPPINGHTEMQHYVAPTSEVEHKLTATWSSLLGLDEKKISVTTSFFELGGHSLLITQLVSKINMDFEINIKVKDFYDRLTVQSLGMYIESLLLLQNKTESIESVNEEDFEDFAL